MPIDFYGRDMISFLTNLLTLFASCEPRSSFKSMIRTLLLYCVDAIHRNEHTILSTLRSYKKLKNEEHS